MRVIPVVDIKGGCAVAAVAGLRGDYKPLKCVLTDCSDPVSLAESYADFGFKEAYVADLDAILHGKPNRDILEKMGEVSLKFMVDVGVGCTSDLKLIEGIGFDKLVLGTETIKDPSVIEEASRLLGAENLVLSLDYKGGLLSRNTILSRKRPHEVALEYAHLVSEVILLDLGSVGLRSGPNLALISSMVGFPILYGGGIRGVDDLKAMKGNVLGVLIGTALYNGKFTREGLKEVEGL